MNLEGKRVFLYIRVSTEEQAKHGESVEDQEQALVAWAKSNKCIVVGKYTDAGFSGHKSYKTRPELQRLLADVQKGMGDLVVFTKFDRWGRKSADYYKMQEILEKNNVAWMAILEDYNTATADGRFKVGIMLSVNQHEAERTSERIKFTFEQKRKRGELCSGNLPKGYKMQDKKPVIDQEKYDGVKAFFDTYLTGAGMNKSIEAAKEAGLRIAYSSATFMLRNASNYTGSIQGVPCDAYITEDQCRTILSTRKNVPRKSGYVYLFSGMIICGDCGRRMGAHAHKLKSGTEVYYNCTFHYREKDLCPNNKNVYERDIEAYIFDTLDDELEKIRLSAKHKKRAEKKIDAESRLRKLEQKKSKLIDLYMDDMITREEYASRREEIEAEIAEISKETPVKKRTVEETEALLPENWKAMYKDLDRIHKRAFWFSLLSCIYIRSDRSVRYEFR